jgi:hypothetical protein
VLRAAGSPEDPAEVHRWQLAEARMAHTPRLMRVRSWPITGRPILDRYVGLLRRVYPELARASGASVIVDSSKTPAAAVILSQLEEVDLYLLHLFRDPRGVAHSWSRGRPGGEGARGPGSYAPGPIRTTGRWLSTNLLGEVVRRRLPADRSMVLRYEEFVRRPQEALRSIISFVEEEGDELPFVSDHTVRLQPSHTASGNRSRFARGEVLLQLDEAWRAGPIGMRITVTGLALPGLLRYGYRLGV